MKRAIVIAALASATLLLTNSASAQLVIREIEAKSPYPPGFDTPQIAPEIPFDMPNPDYWQLPADQNFGEISAVAVNSRGHVFVLSRSNPTGNLHGGSATQVFEFDQNGKWVREIGHNLYSFGFGHGIRIDKDDNIWVVDKGTDMVTKINNKTGKVMMVLGRREELSTPYWRSEENRNPEPRVGWFAQPTDVAWDSQGNIYISDGYINSRVVKIAPDGTWIGHWGKRGTGKGEFRIVHNIAVDRNDHVWVADRSNGRVQVFDTQGNFLREVIVNVPTEKYQPIQGHQYPPGMDALKNPSADLAYRPGAPDALCIPPNNPDVVFLGDLYPGRIYKLDLSGKVLGYFSHVGKKPGETGGLHGLACPNENLIYTAEFTNWRAQKFVLHPPRAAAKN